jgi:spermidine synthase
MLGLGLGSLLGGWVSARLPKRAIVLFGASELGVAIFGLASLRVFHWAATFSAGANLSATVVFGLLLLLFPTMLMGATLPLLVQHFVHSSGRVGFSVSILYFVNTFGSAVACYLCATFLLRDFGQSGSVTLAASMNALIGLTAILLDRYQLKRAAEEPTHTNLQPKRESRLSLGLAMLIAGFSGFIALGFEIAWFRIFALASRDRAPAFALLLSTYLAGVAAGSYISDKLTEEKSPEEVTRIVGGLMLTAGGLSVYLPPLVALLQGKNISFLAAAPAFFVVAGLIGSVLPLLCRLAVSAGSHSGSAVSWTYASNILGSALGSLGIGFFWMHHFGLKEVSEHLGIAAVIVGAFVLFWSRGTFAMPPRWASLAVIVTFVAIFGASTCYSRLFEKLIFGPEASTWRLAHVVENRNGVIAVSTEAAVFGNGVYDGYFNVDPTHDVNLIVRAYALSLFHPLPKRLLMIGLSSGSWAQIMANHPRAESLDIVEINPGYLQLIPEYSCVASLLRNPRVHVYVDDGRRWLLAHPDAQYDVIVMNTSYYWRDHSSDLLSTDFLNIVRRHLYAGGVFFYNTTGSDDVVATGLHVFPYGLRVVNFLAVSDAPIDFSKTRWMSDLKKYRIENRLVFDPASEQSEETLRQYGALADSLDKSSDFQSLETSRSLNARAGKRLIISDENMGWEWRNP